MHRQSVAVFDRFLATLSSILAKAEAHCEARRIKPEVMLAARLFPDMLPLVKQVQLACDFAARGSARLAGQEPKVFPDTETTFAELQARIAAARAHIAALSPDDFAEAPARQITFKAGPMDMTLSGADFLSFYALPQFFFHLTTAYALLRHNGVEIGKGDFMGAV
ncbi:MAG: hypothetical protein B7Z10_04015 [Rhodobacterales bacterium 32-66-7]|nr:MAG: hypothetical protein B7Z10_04015 [Rhodobacterales bacterium 32-66-7]